MATMLLVGFGIVMLLDGSAGAAEVADAVEKAKPSFIERFYPIAILLSVVALVLMRLPKLDLGHSAEYRKRRVANWLPMGLTYAFLYMGRYNLTVAKGALGAAMPIEDFSIIFAAGTITYGLSFLINGPLTDRIGGKKAILIGATGALLANLAMGFVVAHALTDAAAGGDFQMLPWLAVLYPVNMYFQSFGAVAIVKTNAPWFHVRERGVFGAIFGILISLGIYFAFDLNRMILDVWGTESLVFFVPAVALAVMLFVVFFLVKNTPGEAGHKDFHTGDATAGDDSPRLPAVQVFKMMLTNPIILTIAFIEFCSGFLRQAIMNYYPTYTKAIGNTVDNFVYANWGLLLCCAGILGGVFAGIISDRVFNSRRGPVAAVLYGGMLIGSVAAIFLLTSPLLGWLMAFMSLCIIGVHGMLSGTASMDFGGAKNVGIAVGIIDGFVYLGTGLMAGLYAVILPSDEPIVTAAGVVIEAADPSNWTIWPISMIPLAVLGLLLSRKIWNAKPKSKTAGAH